MLLSGDINPFIPSGCLNPVTSGCFNPVTSGCFNPVTSGSFNPVTSASCNPLSPSAARDIGNLRPVGKLPRSLAALGMT